ncbi:transglycosylase SLT domain-containing protein [Thermochromatium tepidum]|uniref:transglycosylase SLT domain-containing protein n=1 Tax=Thermochromatium tepidum TaxID=1050 RepID=UPI001FEB04A4|nr:transglycosylase SLT domain-containing protein [Thermochromatium tepidum]
MSARPSAILTLTLFAVSCTLALEIRADARTDFLAAESALKGGDLETFWTLAEGLREDPLYPYLVFMELTRDLDQTPDSSLESFLSDYPDTPLAERLRPIYLGRLAKAGRWTDYARLYRPDDSIERHCLFLRALIETGRAEEALSKVEPIWLVGRSQPKECDPVFEHWIKAGRLTTDLIWARVRLALEAGHPGLARYIGRQLPESERPWLELWLRVDRTPERVLSEDPPEGSHPMRAAILAHGIATMMQPARGQRAGGRDPAPVVAALQRLEPILDEDPRARERAYGAVGRALAESGDRLGLLYWDAIAPNADNLPEQERRLRMAISLRAWDWVAKWIERMPECEIKRERWLYWLGVAQKLLGQAEVAQATLTEAARERSFWGFMAADRLDRPYNLEHRPVRVAPEQIQTLAQEPAYRRILALDQLRREVDVRREWRTLAGRLDATGLMAAARLAHDRGWHDQAIAMLARSGYWDDLEIRFPLAYRDLAAEESWQVGIEPEWIQAVMRQESVFDHAIASPAGALGLMQLMPKTAAQLATELGLARPSRWDLLNPVLNIRLGSAYLTRMRDRFGHAALATAAYNAGPARVDGWLPETCMDADLWIALIPFAETRHYVERVLSYRIIYAERLGLEPRRLREFLPPVPGRAP